MYTICLPLVIIGLSTYAQLVLRLRLHNKVTGNITQNISFEYLFNIFTDIWICSSIIAFLLIFICWSLALSNNINVTKAYPIITALSIFFVSLSNFIIFQDKVDSSNLLGGALIIFGTLLLLK